MLIRNLAILDDASVINDRIDLLRSSVVGRRGWSLNYLQRANEKVVASQKIANKLTALASDSSADMYEVECLASEHQMMLNDAAAYRQDGILCEQEARRYEAEIDLLLGRYEG